MKDIKNIVNILDEEFGNELSEIKSSLELLKETLQKTKNNVSKSIIEATKLNNFEEAREYVNVTEGLTEYIDYINDMIEETTLTYSTQDNELPDYTKYHVDNTEKHYLDENFKHKRPYAFVLNENRLEVSTWTQMLVETCKILKNKDENKFVSFIDDNDFKGRKRSYFSFSEKNMNKPKKVNCENNKIVFIETNLNDMITKSIFINN